MAAKRKKYTHHLKVVDPNAKAVNDWLRENEDVEVISIQFVSSEGSVSVGGQVAHTFASEGFAIHFRTTDPDKKR